ncbi:hypothetical protein [Paraburkholderia acidisoli]|uniref:Lipoprotein n=1 Tax=Paraburkholderia acidisoli TaxID=2571748 RepID=A0A7Z2GGI2_9BURK|nr:hypothetical protein [Paraburkholderia acidisoli]QGZ61381.1 hypothetical protein FAZ98_06345 [Paraburkholderia acidisoli]
MNPRPSLTAITLRHLRLAALGLLVAASLTGCGVFCGGAGASGGGFFGGCGTSFRF